jgi:hypothetical protein
MRSLKSAKVIGLVALGLVVTYSPIAFAGAPEIRNPGFDANGESTGKVISAINGKKPEGIPGFAVSKNSGPTNNGISFRGGPVMTSTNGVRINLIWYGTWLDNQKIIVKNLISGLNGSAYFNINSTYYDTNKKYVVNKVSFSGESSDAYSVGGTTTALTDADILTIVNNNKGRNPNIVSSDSITLVLTSGDVKKSGFLTNYCGWHTWASISSIPVKYSFVGNPGTNTACIAKNTTISPNGDVGVDAMASVIAHEIVEAVTDPQLNAWYDNRGYENADKCAWTFGTDFAAANGSRANINLGGFEYLIQRNWVNAGGGSCALTYPIVP